MVSDDEIVKLVKNYFDVYVTEEKVGHEVVEKGNGRYLWIDEWVETFTEDVKWSGDIGRLAECFFVAGFKVGAGIGGG